MEDGITLANGGPAALAERRPRMLALYAASKAGSYFATPRLGAAEKARNVALWLTPDVLFGAMAGAVSHWKPPVGVA